MSPSSSSSSRWCPTPEQVMILEELYRSGIRTPNASQIQRITSHLSLYGKIEGKNVFYWFQNHKARDRQKLRRKLIKQIQQHQLYHNHHDHHYHHHHLLGSFLDSPPLPPPPPPLPATSSSPFHPLSYHNSAASFLAHQGGSLEMMTNYPWKVEIPQMENSMMKMYGQDWMMMMEVGPPSPCSPTRPTLETLELFPITTTNLKEERNNKSSSSPSLSTNNSSSEIINFSL